ncbi:hypothetical protein MDA_GLEAN10021782 [Myotis davidii]|uniref:Uncharacterized protein n=1 Tax=Myotis davidii TaxID=225400 RepID=L5MDT2_MYODS|nr:hypothetical protein MDA_GLEAN10021782 [Myotis davidii]
MLLGRRGCPLTQRNSLALPVSGPDWELRGGIGAGSAHPLGTPQARGRSETSVGPRTAGGAAVSPPSEEPEPQDARGRAAALRTQFRWRFPGCSRALISGLLRPPSRPPARRWTSPRAAPVALATARTIN